MSTGNPIQDYKNALVFLNTCGPFDEQKLRETNRCAGGVMSESELQMMVRQAEIIMPTASEPGGMEFIRQQIREQLEDFLKISGKLSTEPICPAPNPVAPTPSLDDILKEAAAARTLKLVAGIEWTGSELKVLIPRDAQDHFTQLSMAGSLSGDTKELADKLCNLGRLDGAEGETLFKALAAHFMANASSNTTTTPDYQSPFHLELRTEGRSPFIRYGGYLFFLFAVLFFIWSPNEHEPWADAVALAMGVCFVGTLIWVCMTLRFTRTPPFEEDP